MPKAREPVRLDVRKGDALFVDGRFVHAESGRAGRKDLQSAVAAARRAFATWSAAAPPARGRALYRLAELLEDRRAQFADRLRVGMKLDDDGATREIDAAIDRTLWYSGWCDKYAALLSSRNPVSEPFYSYSAPEPIGVVGTAAPDEPSLLGLVSAVVPPLVAGNTVVALASEVDPRTAVVFAECVATAELPAGTLNLLTGRRIDVAPHLARHPDVDALEAFALDEPFAIELTRLASDTLKRVRMIPAQSVAEWFAPEMQDLAHVAAFTELKTIWHPARI